MIFSTYTPFSIPGAEPTKLIATITKDGRVYALHTDVEPPPTFEALEGCYTQDYPLDADISPGQLV